MNKFKSIKHLLFLTLIIFTMLISAVEVSAEQLELTAKLPDSVNIGNSFDIIFSTGMNTNIKAIEIKVNYNSDYISFRHIDNFQPSEVKFNAGNGTIDFIILFDSTLKNGDVFKLQFTAKSGNKSSKQNISFEVSEAVDNYLNDVSVKISSNVGIDIIKKGDQTSEKDTASTEKSGTALSDSKSVTSAKSSKSGSEVSGSSSARANNLRTGSTVYSSDYLFNENNSITNNRTIEDYHENDNTIDSKNNTTSISQLGSGGTDIGNLNLKESRAKYIFVGIGITLSIMGILFVVFRLGQLSRRKPESDKMFPEDDNKSED